MFRAEFSKSTVLMECDNFKTLYRAVMFEARNECATNGKSIITFYEDNRQLDLIIVADSVKDEYRPSKIYGYIYMYRNHRTYELKQFTVAD